MRQLDYGFRLVYGEGPAVVGDVPVEFIKVFEEPNHAVGAVHDGIRIDSGLQVYIFLPDENLDAIGHLLGMVGLGVTVSQDLFHLKTHPDGVAHAVAIGRGEVPDDAAPDLAAGTAYRNVLGDGQGGVGIDQNDALKIENPLVLGRGQGGVWSVR